MDGHGRGPGGQRRCHHAADKRAWLVEQDADLHIRQVVQVEHDVAASPVDPARVQAIPHLTRGGAARSGPGLAGHEARSSALLGEFGKEYGPRFLKRRELGPEFVSARG
jgi:hypothetical protein